MLRVGLGRRTLINRMTVPVPEFLLSFPDLGAGQVSTVESANATAATFTRATAAWTKLSTGNWASVNSGVPRSFYTGMDTAVGIYAGYLAEGLRTNSALQSRAATSTVWIKTNITAAQDQVGIDGAANSASSLTATLANGTCFQTVVLASAAKAFSVFAKRVTGTGDVAITLDGGATYTTVTPSINSSTFTQVQATQTVATATVGIKLVSSGDKIAVDMAQLEDGASFASTPIPTTTATATRNADVLTYSTSGWFTATVGTFSGIGTSSNNFGGGGTVAFIACATTSRFMESAATNILRFIDANSNVTAAAISSLSSSNKWAASYSGLTTSVSANGAPVVSGTFSSLTNTGALGIGCYGNDGSGNLFGTVKKAAYYPMRLSDSVLQQLTT